MARGGAANATRRFGMTDFSARRVTMVDTQVRPCDVTKFPIIAAMLAVERENYVPAARREAAYLGGNLSIAPGREMIEARTLAKMLDALNISPGERVLHLGCGLGYGTAVLAEMGANVLGIEEDAVLAGAAQVQLAAEGRSNAAVSFGPLDAAGPAEFAAILIEPGVHQVPPAVLARLQDGGRIAAIFIEGALGAVRLGRAQDGSVTWRFAFNASAAVVPAFATTLAFTL